MFDNYKDVLKEAGYGGSKWWIGKDEFPVKVALVGEYVKGYTKWVAKKKFPCDSNDKDARFNFAINAWDGTSCRKLEGGAALFGALGKLHETTAGLGEIWVKIGQTKDDKFFAEYAGDLSASDKEAIGSAEKIDLLEKCDWAEI